MGTDRRRLAEDQVVSTFVQAPMPERLGRAIAERIALIHDWIDDGVDPWARSWAADVEVARLSARDRLAWGFWTSVGRRVVRA